MAVFVPVVTVLFSHVICHLFLVFRTCSPMKLAAASKWGYPSHWAEILGRGGRFMTHTLPLTLGGVHSGHKHTHTHTHLTDCTIKVKEAMVRKGFWWFFFGHQSQIQQVDAIQKMYKIDVRALVKTLYSQVSFAVHWREWKSLTSRKSVYAVSARTLGPKYHICQYW